MVVGKRGAEGSDLQDYEPPNGRPHNFHRQQSPLTTIKSPPTSTDSLEHTNSSGVDSPLNQSTSDLTPASMPLYTSPCEFWGTLKRLVFGGCMEPCFWRTYGTLEPRVFGGLKSCVLGCTGTLCSWDNVLEGFGVIEYIGGLVNEGLVNGQWNPVFWGDLISTLTPCRPVHPSACQLWSSGHTHLYGAHG